MNDQKEILCPKCGSNQLTANQRGFSGGKALAGAVLTGGIGLLAGTIGNKNVIITCLACGKQFNPGEGKTIEPELQEGHTKEILRLYAQNGWPKAASYVKKFKKMTPLEAKQYVEKLGRDNNVYPPKGGCATMVVFILAFSSLISYTLYHYLLS
jgi:hypothetical protein